MTQPNILFLVLDAVRVDHCSTYGYERETTPTMSRLAADGVRYNHAFAPSIWTPTVHGAVFTGKYPSHTGIYGNSLGIPDDIKTFPEILKRHEYRTFAASAGAHIRRDRGYARGIDEYVESHRISPDTNFLRKVLTDRSFVKQTWFSLTRGSDDKTRYKYGRLERFIRRVGKSDEPFFGFVNAKTAHQPFNPPRPYKEMYCPELDRPPLEVIEQAKAALGFETQPVEGQDTEKLHRVAGDGGDGVLAGEIEMTQSEWDVIRSWYDGAIRYLDDVVGDLMEVLRENDLYEETLIVLTSDHGDNFGDYGMTSHWFCLYDTLLHVPLVIKPPASQATQAGRAIDAQVSLVDLHPTFLDAAGASLPDYELSESLLGFEERQYHEYTFAEYGGFDGSIERLNRKYPDFDTDQLPRPLRAIRDFEYKLIVNNYPSSDTEKELYNWQSDPGETRNLVDEKPEVVRELSDRLNQHLPPLSTQDGWTGPRDDELEEQLKDLGYL